MQLSQTNETALFHFRLQSRCAGLFVRSLVNYVLPHAVWIYHVDFQVNKCLETPYRQRSGPGISGWLMSGKYIGSVKCALQFLIALLQTKTIFFKEFSVLPVLYSCDGCNISTMSYCFSDKATIIATLPLWIIAPHSTMAQWALATCEMDSLAKLKPVSNIQYLSSNICLQPPRPVARIECIKS